MEPFEQFLKTIPLRQPSLDFGKTETLAKILTRESEQKSLAGKTRKMSWKSKSTVAFSLALSAAVAFVALFSTIGSSVTFAQVAEKLRLAKTLTYDWMHKNEKDDKVIGKGRNFFSVPGMIRIEYGGTPNERSYVVLDSRGQRMMFVDGKQKTASVVPMNRPSAIDKAAKAIGYIRSLKEEGARQLGYMKIDGVEAKGFAIDGDTETTVVWADGKTNDPIRIEFRAEGRDGERTSQVWTNIRLDQPIDSRLFSVTPPAGFQVAKSPPGTANATPARVVADFLKIYTDHMDGQFPERLQDAGLALGKKLKPPKANEPPSAEMMQLVFLSTRIANMTRRFKEGKDWQYFAGHTFGETDVVVFWFRDRRTKKYWAVYGDLRLDEVTSAQLPTAKEN